MHNNEFEMPGSALHRLSAVLGAAGVPGDGAGGEGVPGEGVRAGKEGDSAPGGLYAFKCYLTREPHSLNYAILTYVI